MTIRKEMSLRLNKKRWKMRPGQAVPAVVLAHWKETGELDGLMSSGMIENESRSSGGKSTKKATVSAGQNGSDEA